MNRRRTHISIIVLFCAATAWSACVHSPTIDESGHLPAGISHWQLGRFEAYAVNPPLVRLVAALPVLVMHPLTDWSPFRQANLSVSDRIEWPLAKRFIELNGARSLRLWAVARITLIPFVLLGAYATYQLTLENGDTAATFALLLFCSSPDMLSHGSFMTPDATTAALAAATIFVLREWMKSPSWISSMALAAVGTSLMMAKATFVVLLPVILIAAVVLQRIVLDRKVPVVRHIGFCAVIATVSLFLINLLYGFEGTGTPLGQIPFKSQILARNDIPGVTWPQNRFTGTVLENVSSPVPPMLLQGIDVQRGDFEQGYRSYLMGEWKHGGWPYYYLVGFLVKQPIGFQLMLYASILHGLWHWRSWTQSSICRWSVTLLPAILVFGLVSSQTGFNHHTRYVLPALPFLFVLAARTASLGRSWQKFAMFCVLWQVYSVLCVAPHWLSYFNEAAGGSPNGHKWLLDSNIDWGQDISGLIRWQKQHPERKLHAALFAAYDPSDLGLQFELPPPWVAGHPSVTRSDGVRGPIPGWHAISVCQLKGHQFPVSGPHGTVWSDGQFSYFMDCFEPAEMIGYSIYIYHITADQAAKVRAALAVEESELAKGDT